MRHPIPVLLLEMQPSKTRLHVSRRYTKSQGCFAERHQIIMNEKKSYNRQLSRFSQTKSSAKTYHSHTQTHSYTDTYIYYARESELLQVIAPDAYVFFGLPMASSFELLRKGKNTKELGLEMLYNFDRRKSMS